MFRPFAFVGVASAAIIESRPHEHLQMANAQLQNATDAVIKTAAVAGLAYAGAYMAGLEAGMTTSGSSYDSSRKSQESSTGARYCNTRERDPLQFRCTADYFNGKSQDGADGSNAVLAVRDYWCCPSSDLGGQFQGNLDGTCVASNNGAKGWPSNVDATGTSKTAVQIPSTCVYQGPCAIEQNTYSKTIATNVIGGAQTPDFIGSCSESTNDGTGVGTVAAQGIFGGLHSSEVSNSNPQATNAEGPSAGNAFYGSVAATQCCQWESQVTPGASSGKSGSSSVAYNGLLADALIQPTSFCIAADATCPSGYINGLG